MYSRWGKPSANARSASGVSANPGRRNRAPPAALPCASAAVVRAGPVPVDRGALDPAGGPAGGSAAEGSVGFFLEAIAADYLRKCRAAQRGPGALRAAPCAYTLTRPLRILPTRCAARRPGLVGHRPRPRVELLGEPRAVPELVLGRADRPADRVTDVGGARRRVGRTRERLEVGHDLADPSAGRGDLALDLGQLAQPAGEGALATVVAQPGAEPRAQELADRVRSAALAVVDHVLGARLGGRGRCALRTRLGLDHRRLPGLGDVLHVLVDQQAV